MKIAKTIRKETAVIYDGESQETKKTSSVSCMSQIQTKHTLTMKILLSYLFILILWNVSPPIYKPIILLTGYTWISLLICWDCAMKKGGWGNLKKIKEQGIIYGCFIVGGIVCFLIILVFVPYPQAVHTPEGIVWRKGPEFKDKVDGAFLIASLFSLTLKVAIQDEFEKIKNSKYPKHPFGLTGKGDF